MMVTSPGAPAGTTSMPAEPSDKPVAVAATGRSSRATAAPELVEMAVAVAGRASLIVAEPQCQRRRAARG